LNDKQPVIKVRRWKIKDIPAIVACYQAAYPMEEPGRRSDQTYYEMQLAAFPEGQFLVEVDGKVVGYSTSLIVQLDDDTQLYDYQEITGSDTFSTHNLSGDTLYGADIAVHPDCRQQGLSTLLYDARRKLVERYNLRRMIAYGRLAGYAQFSGKMTADGYVQKVIAGELKDPALSAHLKAGYSVKRVLLQYFEDKESLDHSTFLEWLNPNFDADKRRISVAPIKTAVRKARICAAQFYMRRLDTWEEFENTVEFFADSADAYHCHFLVMPELFTAQLFSTMPKDYTFEQCVEALADLHFEYCELFERLACERQLYIIAGSHPVRRDGRLYNVSHLFTPSGKVYTQDKLHITPEERDVWGISPGEEIKIFETPYGKIAIQVCYDIEFPEVSRLLALAGVEIVFCPMSTDERKGYNRVRYCAQARAVENYFYVVVSSNVGNLPTTKNYLLNYGQSAILTPSDHAFPREGIIGEAEPNAETVVTAELDLSTLAYQRELGSVRPFFDRRPDLYSLTANKKIKIIRVE
jgi:predicted amidohydrolase/ribosomal protein S18 acetylase RimI-like enzyme